MRLIADGDKGQLWGRRDREKAEAARASIHDEPQ
jgi:hypothetical protein